MVTCKPNDTRFFGDGSSYYQVKNVETRLCLDDHIMTDKWKFDAFEGKETKLYLRPCDSKKKQFSQYFKFDKKSGALGKVPEMIKIDPNSFFSISTRSHKQVTFKEMWIIILDEVMLYGLFKF